MRCAGEGEVVDVGGAVVGPFGDVVGLAEVSGDVAAGVGAAASPAVWSSIDSAQTASTAASTTTPNRIYVRTVTTLTGKTALLGTGETTGVKEI
ncbi:Uncharacterised protein [Mycobacteroides abscessus subsp. abscessus]|nr:Uncharacterised protein [Mycobacteroides abscessus subsp. abscessus]SLL34338.1 Uncharacterised protein [Mycobacteroides abscessus subsp. abscessus]